MKLENTFLEYFSDLNDPRQETHCNFRHNLTDILVITILATICGADGWVEIYQFGLAKESWLKTFLELPNGIPSPDTLPGSMRLPWVFSRLNSHEFEACFAQWIASLSIDLKHEIIALDAKTLRGSGNKRQGHRAIHMVSAWAAKNRIMLAQVKTAQKSNEITAMPQVLKMIDMKDAIVTIDAMGCQTEIAKQIMGQGAHYVLSLKENQPNLYQDVVSIFALAEQGEKKYKNMLHQRKVEKIHDHGRVETRRYTLISARDGGISFGLRFPGLQGLGKVEITRTTHHEVEHSTRYFVTG